ncbi:MAG: transglutaminase-like domain-containing protein [Agathobacter sp.]|nr:transglutaminase-like domain-containing protein [Agathobacter sp.]
MEIVPYNNNIEEYLKSDNVIDYDNESIQKLADSLFEKADSELEFIKHAYEFVRDNVAHSADIGEDLLTCAASEVLEAGHGICFAKSHLLAAILRCKSIPAGLCYQKLILDDETMPILVYHGLNGVYIRELDKWIRLDARGNRPDIDAQFSMDNEQLAFEVRQELGEMDSFVIYPNPDVKIVDNLRENKTRTNLMNNLPTELGYLQ